MPASNAERFDGPSSTVSSRHPAFLAEPAHAKINLYLHVIGRRPDGYHQLDSLVAFAGAADRLTAEPANDLSLTIGGPFAAGLAAEPDNLVLRAARALGVCARLHLAKNLPVASGIGGGSADAAAALRLLSRLGGVPIPEALAQTLGADVPVCVASKPCRMGGIGECLTPAPALPACGIALVNPGIAVPTASVFRARTGGFSAPAPLPASWPDAAALAAYLAPLGNDLQAPAIGLCPAIAEVLACLASLPGCLLARMSGSGATCFALFATPAAAAAAATTLARPGWWCWGGPLRGA